jgi:hypothetical protein
VKLFPRCGDASGYTLDDIKTFDVTLIDYTKKVKSEESEEKEESE